MDYPKFVTQITDCILQAKNLNVLWKRAGFYISNLPPVIWLQTNAQKILRLKNTFRKMEWSGSLNKKLNTFLLTYRIISQNTTSISPAELLMNGKLNSKLNIVKPGAELHK